MVSIEVSFGRARLSTAQARAEFVTTVSHGSLAAGFWVVLRVSVHFLKQNMILRDRRRRADGFGGSKREFTWQAQGLGHFVKIVARAVFCGRCQNVGRRVSFEGLRIT